MIRSLLDKLDSHMREIVAGASITFAMKGVAGLLSIVLNIVIARMLGADGAGLFFLALSVVTIAAVLSRLGFDNVLLRFVAAEAAVGSWAQVRGVYRKCLYVALLAALLAGTLIWIGKEPLAIVVFQKPGLAGPLSVMGLAIPFLVLVNLQAQALKGLKRIFFAQIANGVALPLLTLVGVFLLTPRWGVMGVAGAFSGAAALAGVIGVALWRLSTPSLHRVRPDFPMSRVWRSGLPLLMVATLHLVMEWTATLLLGVWESASDVGIYHVAHRTAMTLVLVLTAVNSIAAPKFAELYRRNEIRVLAVTARNSTRLMIAFASPVLLVLLIFPSLVMGLFGREFVGGASVLSILAVGQFVNVFTGSVGFLLIMSGKERSYRNSTIIAALVNVILCLTLIPLWGIMGAAVATSSGLATLNLGAAYVVWRRLKIQPIPLTLREIT